MEKSKATPESQVEAVNHPTHYGGDTTYEVIKVIEAWGLGFCLGNTVKYIARAGKKSDAAVEDLEKARWYLDREIGSLKARTARTVSPPVSPEVTDPPPEIEVIPEKAGGKL